MKTYEQFISDNHLKESGIDPSHIVSGIIGGASAELGRQIITSIPKIISKKKKDHDKKREIRKSLQNDSDNDFNFK